MNHDAVKKEPTEDELYMRWMRGNESAVGFCRAFMYVIHLWDDLIDKDCERNDQDINTAFRILFDLPMNEFYLRHYHQLQPVIATGINAWVAANVMEQGLHDADLDVAYAVRCNILSVIIHAAQIIGGSQWAEQVAVEVWRFGMRESLADYKDDLKGE